MSALSQASKADGDEVWRLHRCLEGLSEENYGDSTEETNLPQCAVTLCERVKKEKVPPLLIVSFETDTNWRKLLVRAVREIRC